MEISKFQLRLEKKGAVFIKDTYYDIAVRAVLVDDKLKAFLKHKGSKEVEVPQYYETFCDVLLGGDEITEKEYERY